MRKISVIDMGTNSVRLLLCEFNNGKIINRNKKLITTRLGEGVDKNKKITDRAINDTVKAVKEFVDEATNKNYSIYKIIGTSALRDAENSYHVVDDIKTETGYDIDIISGKAEAKFGYEGVVNSIESTGKNLVIDIGGGSTELIFGNNNIDLIDSLNIGAVRMTDRCVKNEIPTEDELDYLRNEIDIIIDEFIINNDISSFDNVIGIGGTITTLSAINLKMDKYDLNLIQGSKFNYYELSKIIKKFISVDFNKRCEIVGLQKGRADIIIAGSIILERLFNKFNFTEIIVSDFDNLEGIIFSEII